MKWTKMLDIAEGNIRRSTNIEELTKTGFPSLYSYLYDNLGLSELELNIQIRLNKLIEFYQKKYMFLFRKMEKRMQNLSLEERTELFFKTKK
jgi:hypothetical protein